MPLKIGRNPIGTDRIPTIHFQGPKWLLVWGRVIVHTQVVTHLLPPAAVNSRWSRSMVLKLLVHIGPMKWFWKIYESWVSQINPPKNEHVPCKLMVGRWISFSNGSFSLIFRGVAWMFDISGIACPKIRFWGQELVQDQWFRTLLVKS